MRFGAFASNWGAFAENPRIFERLAVDAEGTGFEFFLASNHFLKPAIHGSAPAEPPKKGSDATIDTISLLTYAAAKTSKIRLGTLVAPLPLYHPLMFAKVVASLDVLSQGRAILGVGAGYDRREFDMFGKWEDAGTRVKRTEEEVRLILQLFTEDRTNFKGRFYDIRDAILEPKPLQGGSLPIWTGAMSDRMLQMTARLGNAWIPSRPLGASLEFYEEHSRKLLSYCKREGRKVTLGLLGHITAEGYSSPSPIIGTISSCTATLEKYQAMGCECFVASFAPLDKSHELMTRFQKEVVPSFS